MFNFDHQNIKIFTSADYGSESQLDDEILTIQNYMDDEKALSEGAPLILIKPKILKWKIGEALNYLVKVEGISLATMSLKMSAENQIEYIIEQTISCFGKATHATMHYDKITGQLNRYEIARLPVPRSSHPMRWIASEPRDITVEAGRFKSQYSLYIAHNRIQKEVWTNTSSLPLIGLIQMRLTYKKMDLSFELESYAQVQ